MAAKNKTSQQGGSFQNPVESIVPSHCKICEVLSADLNDAKQRVADEVQAKELAMGIIGRVVSATLSAPDLKALVVLDAYVTKSIQLSGIQPYEELSQ